MSARDIALAVTRSAAFPPRVDAAYVDGLLRWVVALLRPTPRRRSRRSPATCSPRCRSRRRPTCAEAAPRARAAQAAWAALPLAERIRPLVRLAELVLKEKDRLVDVVQWETGKSRVHASIELLGLPAVTAHYASNAGDYLAEQPGGLRHARPRPHPCRPPAEGSRRGDRAVELPALPRRR